MSSPSPDKKQVFEYDIEFIEISTNTMYLLTENGTMVYEKPYKCCLLPSFISSEQFLESLKKELEELDFYEKSNDLYKFHQVSILFPPPLSPLPTHPRQACRIQQRFPIQILLPFKLI